MPPPTAPITRKPVFDPDLPWRLHPSVALRPERFGALAYSFSTRQLSFLKSPDLVRLVRTLDEHPTATAAAAALGLPLDQQHALLRALCTLASSEMISVR